MSFTSPTSSSISSTRLWRLVYLALALPCVWGEDDSRPAGRVIRQVDNPSNKYKCLVATFGNRLEQDIQFDIMLPPDYETDPHLCEYPKSISEMDTEELRVRTANYTQPVALFVAIGGPCSAEDKARVLSKMQRQVSSVLQLLLVYETNPKFPNGIKSLEPDSDDTSDLNGTAIVKLPFRYVARLHDKMLRASRTANPVFLQPGSESWSFTHSIGGGWVTIGPGRYGNGDGGDGASANYEVKDSDKPWTRYLFIFIPMLMVPWFWAAYNICQGPGRLQFRRNEQGRIVGLRYLR